MAARIGMSRFMYQSFLIITEGCILTLLHDAKEVASPYFLDVLLVIVALEQLAGEERELAGIGQSWHPSVTVEICSQAHMIDAHYPDSVLKMLDSVEDAGLIIKAEETWVERNLADTALLGQCPHLVIGEVAWMVA